MMQFDVSPLKPLSGQDRLKIPLLCHQIHFETLIHVTCVEMVQKISHQNHLKLFLTNMLHYLSLDIMRQSYWIFIQSKLKVIFNKKIDAKIFFASSSKETNYFSSQRNRSVISFEMTLKFNSVEVFKGKVGVTLITEF